MLRNHLRVAFRNLFKRGGHTTINVLGLGVGLAAAIVILLYARHELTYDQFHANAENIYLASKERDTPTGTQITRDTWMPMAPTLRADFAGISNTVRVFQPTQWVQRGNDRFEESVTWTDPSFFDVFSFPLQRGVASDVFDEPFSVVLSPEMAERYFGAEDPIGQSLIIDYGNEYTVTGIFAPFPSNSLIDVDLAIPIHSVDAYEDQMDNWGSSYLSTWLELEDGVSPLALEAQFPGFVETIWGADEPGRTRIILEPMTSLFDALNGNRQYAWVLLGIGFMILAIAIINFTNLATARSMERVREIGMRKVLGARRAQLAGQFLGEAVMLAIPALIVGVWLAAAYLPWFNSVYDLNLGLRLTSSPWTIPGLLVFGSIVGLLAGAYPAFAISNFKLLASVKGGVFKGRRGMRVRHALVVIQFEMAIVLMIGTLTVREQISFMMDADVGVVTSDLITIDAELSDFASQENAALRLETFKQQVRGLGSVQSVSAASHMPGNWGNSFTFVYPDAANPELRYRMRIARVDAQYFETYGIDFLQGRGFSEERGTDQSDALIVNQAALEAFGWTDMEDKTIRAGGGERQIIGVVENYNYQSLAVQVEPVIHIWGDPDSPALDIIAVRTQPGAMESTLQDMEALWAAVDPTRAMPYLIVEDQYAQLYQNEERFAAVAGSFTVFGLVIACLGLFALASLVIAQRIKEVGVRKVMGATTRQLLFLLSMDFSRLVLIAFVIAVPLGYLGMQRWLENFAFQTNMAWWVFAASGAATLAVAWLTVSWHAFRLARTNPVDSLRYE